MTVDMVENLAPIGERRLPVPQNSELEPDLGRPRVLGGLAIGIIDNVLAHWYLLPGLPFQRYRLRLLISNLIRRTTAGATPALALYQTPNPTAYLEFEFARRALMSLRNLGAYLDVSSPWLFPLALLSRQPADRALLMGAAPEELDHLVKAARLEAPGGIVCSATSATSVEPESYDTVTSLSWIARAENDMSALKMLWSALRPGGTLLISLPCGGAGAEESTSANPKVEQRIPARRVYDAVLLKERIFDLVGQPKRGVIYGPASRASRAPRSDDCDDEIHRDWRASMRLGREWRCYSSLRELPGKGVIAMKFVKLDQSVSASTSFSSWLV